jgi:hypothetical protein
MASAEKEYRCRNQQNQPCANGENDKLPVQFAPGHSVATGQSATQLHDSHLLARSIEHTVRTFASLGIAPPIYIAMKPPSTGIGSPVTKEA